MKKIKRGDIVARKSYNKDILFKVEKFIESDNVIISGIFERIIADSNINDLVLIDKKEFVEIRNRTEIKRSNQESRIDNFKISGKILHLDGDKKYSEKSMRYYQSIGIRAVVKNIAENKQPRMVYNLLRYYKPDILVITGHDRNDKQKEKLLRYIQL